MCGFAGEFLWAGGRADEALARRMSALLKHRGPDEESGFISPDGRCAIGFQRLAVIDPRGSHQPMSTPDGKVTVAFNGEIYNFRELRAELQRDGYVFRTAGDTEVLLALYCRSGSALGLAEMGEELVGRLSGMFAFAIYDARRGRLLLARDRLGQKPLWYAVMKDRIVFGSQARAVLAHPMVDRTLDRQSLLYYASLGYIPAPRSAWAGLRKLEPASTLAVESGAEAPRRYWLPQPAGESRDSAPPAGVSAGAAAPPAHRDGPPAGAAGGGKVADESQWIDRVRDMLQSAVSSHMVSDVPLGALLSGGLDSSIITALMAKAAGRTGGVRTFTAGFDDPRFDERPIARLVARHCGTQHTELLIHPSPREVLDVTSGLYDEPFGDSSAAATWLICREARRHVTVALAGDGGDEVFGGYDRYVAMSISQSMRPGRYFLLRLAGAIAGAVAPHHERNRLRRLARFTASLPQPFPQQYFTFRRLFSPADLPDLFCDGFLAAGGAIRPDAPAEWFCKLYEDQDLDDECTRAQWHDMMTYLPDDLLVKSDIASMAASLELRAPMLDHQLAPLGLSLPNELKIKGRRGKQILRLAFRDMLPAEVFRQPKRGFGLPLGDWLRGDLCEPMREVLLDSSFLNAEIIRPQAIHGLINDHLTGRDDHTHRLWTLIMLAKWLNGLTAPLRST